MSIDGVLKNKKVESILKNKKLLSIIGAVLAIIVVVILIIAFSGNSDKKEIVNDLKVKYSGGQEIVFDDFKKPFTEKRTITIENTSNESRTYSLEWSGVSNKLKKQNLFVYTIKGEGSKTAELGRSQVPVAESVVFTQVLIEAKKTQTYTVEFKYENNEGEKSATFKGKLKVHSEVVDKKKVKAEEKKERERIEKEIEAEKKAEEEKKKGA